MPAHDATPASSVVSRIADCIPSKLNGKQRSCLNWLMKGRANPLVWSTGAAVPSSSDAVVVVDAFGSLERERLLRSLHADAIVVLPCSEDPLFDSLKTRLFAHGTVGADGAEGPHQFWWGGLTDRRAPLDAEYSPAPVVATCYAPDIVSVRQAQCLMMSINTLKLPHAISRNDLVEMQEAGASVKAQHIINTWDATDRPVLWVQPDCVLQQAPIIPFAGSVDFAARRQSSGSFDGAVLYFGRSKEARSLLRTWQRLCLSFCNVPTDALLDRAWSLVTSQSSLSTVWLPSSFYSDRSVEWGAADAMIVRYDVDRRTPSRATAPPASEHSLFGALDFAPEAQFVMCADADEHGPIVVLAHNVESEERSRSCELIETAAAAFAQHSGGFSHMEVILCRSKADFRASINALQDSWVVVTSFSERFSPTDFWQFGNIAATNGQDPLHAPPEAIIPSLSRSIPPDSSLTSVKRTETFLTRASALTVNRHYRRAAWTSSC